MAVIEVQPMPEIVERISFTQLRQSFKTIGLVATKRSYQSANFVSGSAGWQLTAEGNLEANDGTFRGTLTGNSITIGTNAWHVDTDGNMWWGSSSTYAGATIKISSAGSVNFTTGTFSGTLSAASGSLGAITVGTNAWHIDSSGNMWWGNFANYASASIKISAAGNIDFTTGNFSGTLVAAGGTLGTITAADIKTAASGSRVHLGASTNEIDIYFSGEQKSSIVGLAAELRLRMEQAGGYVTLYAQNDANNPIEVLRADGNAGVSIPASLLLTTYRVYINKTGATAGVPLDIDNAGISTSITLNQTNASNSASMFSLSHSGTGQGIVMSLSHVANAQPGLNISHAGTGYVAAFSSIDHASRTQAVVYIQANSGRGAHLHLVPIANAPASPAAGDLYADTDGKLYYFNGAWKEIAFV